VKIKNEKGAVNVDISTGIIVFIIGSVAVLGLYLTIYKSMARIKIDEMIISYITEICENIDLKNYEDVNTKQKIDSLIAEVNIPEGYNISCDSIEESSIIANNDKSDVVKKINLKVEYKLNNETRDYIVSKIKVKE